MNNKIAVIEVLPVVAILLAAIPSAMAQGNNISDWCFI
jgi:hypothetical protein